MESEASQPELSTTRKTPTLLIKMVVHHFVQLEKSITGKTYKRKGISMEKAQRAESIIPENL